MVILPQNKFRLTQTTNKTNSDGIYRKNNSNLPCGVRDIAERKPMAETGVRLGGTGGQVSADNMPHGVQRQVRRACQASRGRDSEGDFRLQGERAKRQMVQQPEPLGNHRPHTAADSHNGKYAAASLTIWGDAAAGRTDDRARRLAVLNNFHNQAT